MLDFITALDSGWKIVVPLIIPIVTQAVFLLFTNRFDRITFSFKKLLYVNILKVALISFLGTAFFSILAIAFLVTEENKLTLPFIVFVYILYFVSFSWIYPNIQRKHRTYFYVDDTERGILYIQRLTVDNKILLSSTRDISNKTARGYVYFEDISYLNNRQIHFTSKEYINWMWRSKTPVFPRDFETIEAESKTKSE